jgi:hypothetical protein
MEGRLPPGGLLPPVRSLADALGISASTVAAAYRTLRSARPRGRARAARRHAGGAASAPPPAAGPRRRSGRARPGEGNPDPPGCRTSARPCAGPWPSGLYGGPTFLPALRRLAARQLEQDHIPAASLAVVGGAMDGVERVLQAHLRAGDRIAVEDPGTRACSTSWARWASSPARPPRRLRREAGSAGIGGWPRARAPSSSPRAPRTRRGRLRRGAGTRACAPFSTGIPTSCSSRTITPAPSRALPALTLAHPRQAPMGVVRSCRSRSAPTCASRCWPATRPRSRASRDARPSGAGWVSHVLQSAVAFVWANAATDRRPA